MAIKTDFSDNEQRGILMHCTVISGLSSKTRVLLDYPRFTKLGVKYAFFWSFLQQLKGK